MSQYFQNARATIKRSLCISAPTLADVITQKRFTDMVVKALVHLGVDIADHCVVTASAARAVKPTIANAVNSLVCCAPGMAIASEVSKAFGKCHHD